MLSKWNLEKLNREVLNIFLYGSINWNLYNVKINAYHIPLGLLSSILPGFNLDTGDLLSTRGNCRITIYRESNNSHWK